MEYFPLLTTHSKKLFQKNIPTIKLNKLIEEGNFGGLKIPHQFSTT